MQLLKEETGADWFFLLSHLLSQHASKLKQRIFSNIRIQVKVPFPPAKFLVSLMIEKLSSCSPPQIPLFLHQGKELKNLKTSKNSIFSIIKPNSLAIWIESFNISLLNQTNTLSTDHDSGQHSSIPQKMRPAHSGKWSLREKTWGLKMHSRSSGRYRGSYWLTTGHLACRKAFPPEVSFPPEQCVILTKLLWFFLTQKCCVQRFWNSLSL